MKNLRNTFLYGMNKEIRTVTSKMIFLVGNHFALFPDL